MKKQSTVIWFYAVIACFSFVVIFGMRYLGQVREKRAQESYEGFSKEQYTLMREKDRTKFQNFGIKEDLNVTLHDGREVNLKEALKDKVTVFAQFFSDCPQCKSINFEVLKKVLANYPNEELQIVTVNVNSDVTDLETMKEYAASENGANGDPRWWFANTDTEKFNEWSQKNLGYAKFFRTEGDAAAVMAVTHDMNISVMGPDLVMVNMENIFSAKVQREGSTAEQAKQHADGVSAQLMRSISQTLSGEIYTDKKESKVHIYLAVAAGLLVAAITGFFVANKMRKAK